MGWKYLMRKEKKMTIAWSLSILFLFSVVDIQLNRWIEEEREKENISKNMVKLSQLDWILKIKKYARIAGIWDLLLETILF